MQDGKFGRGPKRGRRGGPQGGARRRGSEPPRMATKNRRNKHLITLIVDHEFTTRFEHVPVRT